MTISSLYGATVPANVDAGDDGQEVTLGVKLRISVDGWITHVRFYRSAANSGIHTVNLWSVVDWATVGTLLASQDTDGTEAAGWVEVQLTTAIPVVAGTNYLAAYHTVTTHYSYDPHFFDNAVVSGQLIGLKSADNSGNGVFGYSNNKQFFPTLSFESSYAVDVNFTDTNPVTTTTTGNLSVTEAGDTLTSAASAIVGIALAVTEAGDTLTSAAVAIVGIALAVTEGGDTLNASGSAIVGAALAVTEAGDTLNSNVLVVGAINASLNVTEAGDTLTSSATLLNSISADLAVTEAGDTLIARVITNASSVTKPTIAITMQQISRIVLVVAATPKLVIQRDPPIVVVVG